MKQIMTWNQPELSCALVTLGKTQEFQGRLWRPRPGCKATEHCAGGLGHGDCSGKSIRCCHQAKGYPRQTFQEGSITQEYKCSGSSPGRALCAASWCYAWSTLPSTPTDKNAAWRAERERTGWPWMTWRNPKLQKHRHGRLQGMLGKYHSILCLKKSK